MWIAYSIFAAICFTGLFLIFKNLEMRGVPTVVSLVWVVALAAFMYLGQVVLTKQSIRVSGAVFLLLVAAGALSYIGNLLQFRATAMAPNPGYAVALVSVQALLVTIASVWIFGSDFSMMKGLGVVLCVCGVALLSLA